MYVDPRPLTFADLTKAVQRDAGLGQVDQTLLDAMNANNPVQPQSVDALNNSVINSAIFGTPVVGGGTVGTVGTVPWMNIALVAGGLILFSMFVGKK